MKKLLISIAVAAVIMLASLVATPAYAMSPQEYRRTVGPIDTDGAAPELSPKDRKDTIEGLLLYEYIAWVANSNCPGMTWNRTLILAARKAIGMTEAEKTTGELALSETVVEINSTLRRDGNQKWCAAAFEMLGPRGLLIKE